MSLLINILIIIIIAIIVIIILNYFFFQNNILFDKLIKAQTVSGNGINDIPFGGSSGTIIGPDSGTGISGTFIPHSEMPTNNLSSNFMFSIWFFIDNYTTNFNKYKKIASIIGIDGTDYKVSLDLTLNKKQNNLSIGINTGDNNINNSFNTPFMIANIPLQKWNCLIISVNNQTMDVYLEGKLINSYILNSYYQPIPNSNIWLGNNTSNYFDGYLTRVRYQASSISPEEAYTIYKEGINSGLMSTFLNKYRLKVGFYEYDTEKANFTI